MSETVTLTKAEYEALKASPSGEPVKMVEISEAELKKLRGQLELSQKRCGELETLLKREQRDHQEEYNELLKRVTGGAV